MIKTFRVMLLPNNKQRTRMFQYAGASRFAYNWAIGYEEDNYKNGGKFINDGLLRKEFTKMKKQEEHKWLNNVSCNVTKQAIKDACDSYKKFFNGLSKHPKFKSKKHSCPSFYQDSFKIQFTDTHVKLECIANSIKRNRTKLNWVRLAEHGRIPPNSKYYNPRIKYDGLNWYITVGIEYEDCKSVPTNDGIGIDLGIKDLAVCSDKVIYKNINKKKKIKKLKKRQRRLQRSVSRKYEKNKKGGSYRKTSNIIKREKECLKVNRKLANIRHNYIHQTTSEIVKRKPSFICIEDLNVKGMMKNRHLSKAIQEQCFQEFRRQIEYKSLWNNIKVIVADRFYPSSKMCCVCGSVKNDLKLSDRTYRCDCGNVIDRDYQASLNLKNYGYMVLKSTI